MISAELAPAPVQRLQPVLSTSSSLASLLGGRPTKATPPRPAACTPRLLVGLDIRRTSVHCAGNGHGYGSRARAYVYAAEVVWVKAVGSGEFVYVYPRGIQSHTRGPVVVYV